MSFLKYKQQHEVVMLMIVLYYKAGVPNSWAAASLEWAACLVSRRTRTPAHHLHKPVPLPPPGRQTIKVGDYCYKALLEDLNMIISMKITN